MSARPPAPPADAGGGRGRRTRPAPGRATRRRARGLGTAAAGLLVGLAALLPSRAGAQPARLQGHVVLGPDSAGLEGGRVVLHRVTADTGLAVDSTRSGPGGSFSFRLPASDSQDIWLVTVRHEGVLYVGSAVHGPEPPDDYRVAVFPARREEEGASLSLVSRTLVLAGEDGGVRVMDVVDVGGVPGRTLVGPDGGGAEGGSGAAGAAGGGAEPGARAGPGRAPWWSVALPPEAREVTVLPGGVGPEEVRFASGEARVSAAVPPSGKRLVVGYLLEEGRPLALVPFHPVGRVEVLVREGTAVETSGLEPAGAVQLSSSTMERYLARDLAPGDTIRVTVQGAGGGGSFAGWIVLAAGVVLAAAAGWSWRRSAAAAGRAPDAAADGPGGPEAGP